ncbi:hypothetical protein LINGRAHAP2_LOCUS16501 [Linum grandiflorum]
MVAAIVGMLPGRLLSSSI